MNIERAKQCLGHRHKSVREWQDGSITDAQLIEKAKSEIDDILIWDAIHYVEQLGETELLKSFYKNNITSFQLKMYVKIQQALDAYLQYILDNYQPNAKTLQNLCEVLKKQAEFDFYPDCSV